MLGIHSDRIIGGGDGYADHVADLLAITGIQEAAFTLADVRRHEADARLSEELQRTIDDEACHNDMLLRQGRAEAAAKGAVNEIWSLSASDEQDERQLGVRGLTAYYSMPRHHKYDL